MLRMQTAVFDALDDGGLTGLHDAIQTAIELEHATMPPYLFALYSLGTSNQVARSRLRSIVREEMLHMLLACNLLVSIGGQPRIDSPAFVPHYPGPLPGTIATGLSVPLRPYSLDLVKSVFMAIEEPEHPLKFAQLDEPARTIGIFYDRIKERIQTGGAALFVGNPNRQATSDGFTIDPELQRVTNLESALRAIDIIVRQGEGTATSPLADTTRMAHYYRFAELVEGKELVLKDGVTEDTPPEERYSYSGTPLIFDAAGVLPLRPNPTTAGYPAGSPARSASDTCNATYTAVLKLLQKTFDSDPSRIDDAVSAMNDLRATVVSLTEIELDDGSRAAPTFEYVG